MAGGWVVLVRVQTQHVTLTAEFSGETGREKIEDR